MASGRPSEDLQKEENAISRAPFVRPPLLFPKNDRKCTMEEREREGESGGEMKEDRDREGLEEGVAQGSVGRRRGRRRILG